MTTVTLAGTLTRGLDSGFVGVEGGHLRQGKCHLPTLPVGQDGHDRGLPLRLTGKGVRFCKQLHPKRFSPSARIVSPESAKGAHQSIVIL